MIANNCTNIHFFSVTILSYIIGSIPFAVLTSIFLGLEDPRNFGSKNPGATNMLRTGNKIAAIITLLGDMIKGFIAIKITTIIYGINCPKLMGLSIVFVVLGHMYPVFANFRGGKGIATFFGILSAINPLSSVFYAISWIIISYIWKYSSMSSIVTVVIAITYYFIDYKTGNTDREILISIMVVGILLIYKHKKNIKKLINGTENSINF
ncbi:glycerol-3-phosphate acyltransferase PlsY [Candidatus Kinetoplastibacterium blastocrithidii TCC012E]|uniref:Glycerol-3-phosphate acyltransferase n=1 Tax=Candidatus Kinetoplastidibacterium blastocrithidiae TCC012E TaxID=1208922 RepID=M1M067_9PROT|nr:glycerol-3-phosphate 1-O-acyltransferase PlsY [Candidatus Kinetoplastibacterium blastocrithidii]AFZ83578.1 glycerol-3-phosphate acyltransferase [Candidatus Kinetoplastibacterium blastocrithidii (ex Strigomonas culicis)]AGF49696.1 glycerol-3-phosphate acyltransferase PlsY [Candidatus Kinetoplastibacterium blastocrithidii TCC012E]